MADIIKCHGECDLRTEKMRMDKNGQKCAASVMTRFDVPLSAFYTQASGYLDPRRVRSCPTTSRLQSCRSSPTLCRRVHVPNRKVAATMFSSQSPPQQSHCKSQLDTLSFRRSWPNMSSEAGFRPPRCGDSRLGDQKLERAAFEPVTLASSSGLISREKLRDLFGGSTCVG
jgi:hypothetical protein